MSGPEGYSDAQIERIVSGVETMEESPGVLSTKAAVSRQRYENDSETRDVVERRFVKLTEAAIDIGTEILKAERHSVAETNPATMEKLAAVGVLPIETATQRERQRASETYSLTRTANP